MIVGQHVLEASAPEYSPWRRELNVRAREHALLSVRLTPIAKEPAPVQVQRDDAPRTRRWLWWTSLGVLVAAGALTGVVLALNRDEPARASGGNSGVVWTLER